MPECRFERIAATGRLEVLTYERSETRTLGGREMRLQRPEDIIAVRVLLGRPKDIRDIRLLDRLPDLDRRHLARWLGRLGLTEAYRLAVGGASR